MIKGLHFVRKMNARQGVTWYVYAFRGGPCVMKHVGAARPKLSRSEVEKLLEAIPARDEGTLAQLIRLWRGPVLEKASPEWRGLAQGTRDTWGFELDRIEAKWGGSAIAVWNDPRMVTRIVDWRDSRAATPRAADQGVTVLYELLKFARLRGMLKVNVAADIPGIYRGADRAEIIWTDADIAAYRAFALSEKGRGAPVVDILDLASCTGMRRSDLAAITWAEVSDHAIVRTALKKSRGRRRRAVIPLTPQSRAVLERLRSRHRAEGVETLLVNSFGRAWTPGSLTQAFNETRDGAYDGAGIVQPGNPAHGEGDRKKHLHDCRGTFVTHLCQTDLTNEEIARIVAWSPENVDRVRRLYVDDAAVVVALAERIARGNVNRAVN